MASLFDLPKRRSKVTVTRTDAVPEPIPVNGHAGSRICAVCIAAIAPYLCPACNTPFCSVKCYQTHGATCTEGFFRRKVCQSMGTNLPSSAEEEVSFISALREGRRAFPPSSLTAPEPEPTSVPGTDTPREAVVNNDITATKDEVGISTDRLYQLSSLADLSIGDLSDAERRAFEVRKTFCRFAVHHD